MTVWLWIGSGVGLILTLLKIYDYLRKNFATAGRLQLVEKLTNAAKIAESIDDLKKEVTENNRQMKETIEKMNDNIYNFDKRLSRVDRRVSRIEGYLDAKYQ